MASHDVARFLAQAARRLDALERSTRLRSSSIPLGLPVYDNTGQLRLTLGQQADGTFTVGASGGPKPPKPSSVILVPEPKGLTVAWAGQTAIAAGEEDPPAPPGDTSGSWEVPWTNPDTTPQYQDPRFASYDGNPPIIDWDDYPTDDTGWADPDDPVVVDPDAEFATPDGLWPADLAHVRIHLAKDTGAGFDPEFECTAANQTGVFAVTDRTLSKTILSLDPEATYWCRLVAVNASGKESRPSDPVSGVAGKDAIDLGQTALEAAIDALNAMEVSIGIIAMDHAVYGGETPPTGGTYAVNDAWIRDSDGQISLWDGTAWVALPPSGYTAAINSANTAAQAAQDAAATATAALTAANGKNQNRWETFAPTNQTNVAGDNWFYTEAGTGNILGQYQGLGGTSWAQRPISSQAIANLDVGKLTAGSGLVNAFTVKTTLTLGDATTNGSIQTYNFASSSVGVYIDKNGVTLKGATITAPVIQSGAAQLDSNGLTIYGTGGTPLLYSSGGDLFVSGQVTGKGLLVTGAQGVQTSSAANVGIKFNSSGLKAYNGSPTPTFALDASTGSVAMIGTINAGSTITGSTFQTSTGNAGVRLDSSGVATFYTSTGAPGVQIVGGFLTASQRITANNELWVTGGIKTFGTGAIELAGPLYPNAGINVFGGITVSSGGITVGGGSTSLGSLSISGAFQTNGNAINGDPSFGTLVGTGGAVYVTTGDSGRLNRGAGTGSRRETKRDIRALDIDPDTWVAVTPYEFTYKDDPSRTKQVGLMIDEMLAAGFDAWVGDHDGKKDAVIHYTHLAVGQQVVLRDHHPRIAALEADRDRMRNELADLRAEVETLRAAA